MKEKIFLVLSLLVVMGVVSAASWTEESGTQLVGGLPSPYEPSGVAWDAQSQKLYVVSDEGIVSRMNIDGSAVENWVFSGDYEGIAVVDGKST